MTLKFLLILALISFSVDAGSKKKWPIKKVIVLMLENRSFDHMCGWLKQLNPEIQGLTGKEFNLYDVKNPSGKKAFVQAKAPYCVKDPDHSYLGTTEEIFGSTKDYIDPAPMSGFVQNMERHYPNEGFQAINMFNYSAVPIISTLAQEYAIFDEWFVSVPACTDPNRYYCHSGTSYGKNWNDANQTKIGYPQKTFYDQLNEVNKTFSIYWHDATLAFGLKNMRTQKNLKRFLPFKQLYKDLEDGTLADYSWIEPLWAATPTNPSNDQHPDHSVAEGERYMKEIYENIRKSKYWDEVLFVITYDEHGGFYDHFPTPLSAPNPDGIDAANFNFTRLGIRVPTILISPWINKGVVIHKPNGPHPDSQYTTTSIIRTLHEQWDLKEHLTKRTEWSGDFTDLLNERTTIRNDCIKVLPEVPKVSLEYLAQEMSSPINALQEGHLKLAAGLNGVENVMSLVSNQYEAGVYMKHLYEEYRDKVLRGEKVEF